MTRTEGHVQFAPFDGVVILQGTIDPAGDIGARLALRGSERTPAQLAFSARLQRARINGTYTTPRCRYAVELALAPY